ncbi:MAG: hypothetical protein KA717_15445 [Woronichinia naegeliana WA131]|uniref:Uncharacterized protein n=1 Tax=Woronichinia naegeliana WA131 TaxID=2824559 RepID=A0A977PZV3_9CYAN|nr:MAG: hypothetical protein KA717_15445 [Woronichinia naegeliana WA131]
MKSDKEETMMTAKLINVEGSKIKIELTLELSRSMLDTEINIQKGLNEVGCIASKEALKYLGLAEKVKKRKKCGLGKYGLKKHR